MSDHGRSTNGASASADPIASDVFEESRSKEYSRGSSRISEDERGSSKNSERGSSKSRELERDRDRDREGVTDRVHRNRDYRERNERRGHDSHGYGDHRPRRDDRQRSERRGNDNHGGYGDRRSHREDRQRSERNEHNGDGSNDRRHQRDSRERRSDDHDRQNNREPRDSKRVSGFDMAPSGSAMMPLATGTGQITGNTAPVVPGAFPNAVHYMSQQATRHARRVYVGGLSPMANEQTIATFFSQVMSAIGGNSFGPGDAVVNVYINQEKKFAFVEMRTVEEASNAMALDGIIFEGAPVKVRRPSDYNPSLAAPLGPGQPNPNLNIAAVGLSLDSSTGLDGPDRIFVCGFPYYFTEEQIKELFEAFGPLRSFVLIKDRETGNSKGYAFCVYQNLSVIDIACAALNGMKMGDKTLTVRRANQTSVQPKPEQENVLMDARQQVAYQMLLHLPTKVVCLLQVVSEDDLNNDEDYEALMEDMKIECEKYGKLVNVVIPRPGPNGEPAPGVKKVFLEYEETIGSVNARQALNGRKFDGNHAIANFYPEDKFAQGDYDS